MRISSPPTTGPCYYGIDTPTRERADRLHRTRVEEIRAAASAPTAWPTSRTRACWRRSTTPPGSATARPASPAATRSRSRSPRTGSSRSSRSDARREAQRRMPRLLAVGPRHLGPPPRAATCSAAPSSYAALAARKLGWEAAVLTARRAATSSPRATCRASPSSCARSPATTRFVNEYDDGRHAPAGDRARARGRARPRAAARRVARSRRAASWRRWRARSRRASALAFEAEVVGAGAQGWLRAFDADGAVTPRDVGAIRPRDLAGVHVLFLSQHDLPRRRRRGARACCATCPWSRSRAAGRA